MKSKREIALEKCLEKTLKFIESLGDASYEDEYDYWEVVLGEKSDADAYEKNKKTAIRRIQLALKVVGEKKERK